MYDSDKVLRNKVCKSKQARKDISEEERGGVYVINSSQVSAITQYSRESDHSMDLRNSRLVLKISKIRQGRVFGRARIRSNKVLDENKGLTSEDPLSRTSLLR